MNKTNTHSDTYQLVSAAYIANWLTKLENDNRLVVHAAAKAQKAADWILNRTEQPRIELPMAA